MTNLFIFFGLVILAVTGALEWLKALTWKRKMPAWVMPLASLVICLVAGILGAYAGFFVSFTEATGTSTLAGGILLGFVALACVELAYQLMVQLVFALIKAITRGLNSLFDDRPAITFSTVQSPEAGREDPGPRNEGAASPGH